MSTAFLGLTEAVIFGSADFVGGLAAKRISATLVTAVVLRERIAPVQWLGLALTLTAAGMLAIA